MRSLASHPFYLAECNEGNVKAGRKVVARGVVGTA